MLKGANEVIVCLFQTVPWRKEKKVTSGGFRILVEDSETVPTNFAFVGKLFGGSFY